MRGAVGYQDGLIMVSAELILHLCCKNIDHGISLVNGPAYTEYSCHSCCYISCIYIAKSFVYCVTINLTHFAQTMSLLINISTFLDFNRSSARSALPIRRQNKKQKKTTMSVNDNIYKSKHGDVEKLKEHNYHAWKYDMMEILKCFRSWEITKGAISIDNYEDKDKFKKLDSICQTQYSTCMQHRSSCTSLQSTK